MRATNVNNTKYLNNFEQHKNIRLKNFIFKQRYLRHSMWSICLNIDFKSNFVLFYKAFFRISDFL